jgi:hypothetical protein
MTWPATYHDALEATALRLAHEWIERRRQPGGIFHPDAERLYGRVLMKWWALTHPFGADDIVYMAENGSPEADIALREIVAERSDRNEPLGAVLGAYNVRLLNPAQPSKRRGPKPAENFVRDLGISVLGIVLIEELGLAATHNNASKKPTMPSIISRALEEARIATRTPKAVEKISRRFMPYWGGRAAPPFANGFPPDFPRLYEPRSST